MNYRDRIDIIADILRVASPRAKKTQIMWKANLSYTILLRYLSSIESSALITFDPTQQYYLVTEKGEEFLLAYRKYTKTNKAFEKRLGEIGQRRKELEDMCPEAP